MSLGRATASKRSGEISGSSRRRAALALRRQQPVLLEILSGQGLLGPPLDVAPADADVEGLLQAEDEVEQVERIGAEVVDQRRVGRDRLRLRCRSSGRCRPGASRRSPGRSC